VVGPVWDMECQSIGDPRYFAECWTVYCNKWQGPKQGLGEEIGEVDSKQSRLSHA